jgi:hypothetical protein
MNKLTLSGVQDFALTTDALAFMQSAYETFEQLAKLGGDNYIVSGCTVTGSSVSSGYMVLKGKLVYFTGGTIQPNVRIVETVSTVTVDVASRDQTTYYAEFGTSADTTKNVAWEEIESYPAFVKREGLLTDMVSVLDNEACSFRLVNRGGVVNFSAIILASDNVPYNEIGISVDPVFRIPAGFRPLTTIPCLSGSGFYLTFNTDGWVYAHGLPVNLESEFNVTYVI